MAYKPNPSIGVEMATIGESLKSVMSGAVTVLASVTETLRQTLDQVYRRGYEDGANAMREALLSAAKGPIRVPPMPDSALRLDPPRPRPVPTQDKIDLNSSQPNAPFVSPTRAPRGAVRKFITEYLQRNGAQTELTLKQAAQAIEDIASSSVGNELRRNEGVIYRRDNLGCWILIGQTQESAEATQGPPSAAEVQQAK